MRSNKTEKEGKGGNIYLKKDKIFFGKEKIFEESKEKEEIVMEKEIFLKGMEGNFFQGRGKTEKAKEENIWRRKKHFLKAKKNGKRNYLRRRRKWRTL